MAFGGGKKTGKPSRSNKKGQKEKKPLWSYLFEPIPEDDEPEDDFLFDDFDEGRQYGEPPVSPRQTMAPDEDALAYSELEDAVAAARLTWTDGEPVAQEIAIPATMPIEGYAPYQPEGQISETYVSVGGPGPAPGNPDGQPVIPPYQTIDNPYAPLATPVATVDNPYVPLGTPVAPVDNTYTPLGTPVASVDTPYVPLGTPVVSGDNPYTPLGTPVASVDTPYVPLGTPVVSGDNPYVPLGTPVAPVDNPYAPLGTPVAPVDNTYTPLGTPGIPVDNPYAPQGTPGIPGGIPYTQPNPALDFSDEEMSQEDADAIRLFDAVEDADDVRTGERGQTTRLFRTGTGATTRIHINETEDAIRQEEAARRARSREARKRHEAAMERQNNRKKRAAVIRKLFANIAFVLFFIVAVLVALYYGFLLSEVVVLGNDTYSQEYITELSGLEPGTHILLCDLDQAAENIRQDPYLQVEQVNYIFPNRIRIVVSERTEVAGIMGLDYNVIIDDQGYVLSMSGGTDISGLLQVTGVSTTGFQLGQQLGEGNDVGTATLVQIIAKLEEYNLMSAVRSIDMTTPLAITFVASNGLTVHLGQSTDLDNKLSTFARLLPQFTSQNIYQGVLYLSAKGGAVYSPPSAAQDAAAAAGVVPDTEPTVPEDGLDPEQGPSTTPNPDGEPVPEDDPTVPVVTPQPTPSPYNPGGSADDFQG